MRSEANEPERAELAVGFSYTTGSSTPVGFGYGLRSKEQFGKTGASSTIF